MESYFPCFDELSTKLCTIMLQWLMIDVIEKLESVKNLVVAALEMSYNFQLLNKELIGFFSFLKDY